MLEAQWKRMWAGRGLPGGKQGKQPLERLLAAWLESVRPQVKESSYRRYTWVVEKRLCPALGKACCREIGQRHWKELEAYWAYRGNRGAGLSEASMREMLVVLKAALRYGAERGYGCDPGRIRMGPGKAQNKLEVPPSGVFFVLEEYLNKALDPSKLGVLLCMYLGLRIGEICALRWEDVDLAGRSLTIRQTIQRISAGGGGPKTKLALGTPKTIHSQRTVPLPAHLVKPLQYYRALAQAGDYVISNKPGRPLEPRAYAYRFKRYLEKAGVPAMKFHMLRHYFATSSIEAGGDVKTLSEILGHSDVGMTLRVYVHPTMDMKRRHIERTYAFQQTKTRPGKPRRPRVCSS